MIRLLALVQKAVGIAPGQRFRLEQWAPHLEARHGIRIDFLPFESPALTEVLYQPGSRVTKARLMLGDAVRRREVLAKARGYDGVVIYREVSLLGPAIYERLLARTGIPILYDFDDAIWLPAVGTVNGAFARLRFVGKTRTICKLATTVVVGNAYLAAWSRQHCADVVVVPTSIELGKYPVLPPLPAPSDEVPFTIVWTGTVSTLVHLELARRPVELLARRRKVRMRIVCSRPPERPFDGVETVFVPWRADSEAADLGPAHVGIMPLPDEAVARGKCGCKALQYMAVGRPVVIAPVGVNTDIVQSGRNGILATTDDEWVDALESLAASAELRARLAAAGRRTVEEGFSAEASAARFAEAVRSAVRARRA